MRAESSQFFQLIRIRVGHILTRPVWLMAFFILLACMIPFSGGTSPFRSDAFHVIDPFGFSLLTPSRQAFGPHSMLSVVGLILIPALIIHWRLVESEIDGGAACGYPGRNAVPFSAFVIYCLFVLLSLPLMSRSAIFLRPAALGITLIDLIILAIMLAWTVDLALMLTPQPRLQPLVGWITAGGLYIGRSMSDAFVIAPQVREIVQSDWSLIAWHAVLAVIAFTLHALPAMRYRPRVTL
jgi:hypothetical protein